MSRKGFTLLEVLGIFWLVGLGIKLTILAATGKTCTYSKADSEQQVEVAEACTDSTPKRG